MKQFSIWILVALLVIDTSGWAQSAGAADTTLRVNSRAVLVDVIVTDAAGRPVRGLPGGAFSIKEDGKPQTIQYFEEHKSTPRDAQRLEFPKLPENEFSNFSPYGQPAAVNVLLLDSLNTMMDNQSFVHQQALAFLSTARPGDRMAVFTMGKGLHFIQGFNDDPSRLVAALKDKKNNEVEDAGLLKTASEGDAQQKLIRQFKEPWQAGPNAPLSSSATPEFIAAALGTWDIEEKSQATDRIWMTLANLQRLASFLEGFPGRKNIIWFAEKPPAMFVNGTARSGAANIDSTNLGLEREIKRTLSMLSAARAAIYPVQPQGLKSYTQFAAESNLSVGVFGPQQMLGPTTAGAPDPPTVDPMITPIQPSHDSGMFANSMTSEAMARNSDQMNAEYLAEQSGGRAFVNTNGLSNVLNTITMESGDFYTLSYAPSNPTMDGKYRKIVVGVNGKYHVSYRRGYYAVSDELPGSTIEARVAKMKEFAEKNGGIVDPLLPFMDMGMPQNEQILYKARFTMVPPKQGAADGDKTHYRIDFAVDLKDLKLKTDANGVHTGRLNLSMIVFDRYGKIVTREYHVVPLNIPPAVYAAFQESGVQMRGEIAVPHNGNYWLRTGVFDWGSRKVGTMEVPLSGVKPLELAQQSSRDIR